MLVALVGGKMILLTLQALDKPTYVGNNSMSCINLIFCTNKKIISNHGVSVLIFKKFHHYVTYGKINIRVPN